VTSRDEDAVLQTPTRHGVLLTVAYDGSSFAGFAPQPTQRTVAGELLGAIRAMDPTVREIRGASRTDSGVHARGQCVAFDAARSIPPRGWVLGITRHLPTEIAVVRAAVVEPGFVPRFVSVGKLYRYLLFDSLVRDPFLEGRVWRVEGASDPEPLGRSREEAARALGEHDFAAFRSAADERTSTRRTLRSLTLEPDPRGSGLLRIDVEGDAFLHTMVRILVGTLVDVGRGRLAPGAIDRAFVSLNRRDLGITAPPDGLSLERVDLHTSGRDPWPPERELGVGPSLVP